jgi:hypothetical protein
MAQRGHHPERGGRSNQELKDTKQQATMAALQNSSKWGNYVCRMVTDLFNLVWTSEQVPTAWRKGNVTSIFKGGSMDATQWLSPNHSSASHEYNSLQQSSQSD